MFKIILTGNLTKDAEWKPGNQSNFLSFSVAVDMGKNKPAQFISCAINNVDYASKIDQYLLKGQKVLLEGMPKADSYINKEGVSISVFKVYVSTVELIGSKPASANSQQRDDDVLSLKPDNIPF